MPEIFFNARPRRHQCDGAAGPKGLTPAGGEEPRSAFPETQSRLLSTGRPRITAHLPSVDKVVCILMSSAQLGERDSPSRDSPRGSYRQKVSWTGRQLTSFAPFQSPTVFPGPLTGQGPCDPPTGLPRVFQVRDVLEEMGVDREGSWEACGPLGSKVGTRGWSSSGHQEGGRGRQERAGRGVTLPLPLGLGSVRPSLSLFEEAESGGQDKLRGGELVTVGSGAARGLPSKVPPSAQGRATSAQTPDPSSAQVSGGRKH